MTLLEAHLGLLLAFVVCGTKPANAILKHIDGPHTSVSAGLKTGVTSFKNLSIAILFDELDDTDFSKKVPNTSVSSTNVFNASISVGDVPNDDVPSKNMQTFINANVSNNALNADNTFYDAVGISVSDAVNVTIHFLPAEVDELLEGEEKVVCFNFTPCCVSSSLAISVRVDDNKIAEVTENATMNITDDMLTSGLGYGSFLVLGKRLGLAELSFWLHDADQEPDEEGEEPVFEGYRVVVLRERQLRDDIYRYGIITFAIIIYFGFGCQINLSVIWGICKKPVAPAIGLACQFVIMPLLGVGVAKLTRLDDVYAFGLLVMSCSPGGGGSNTWAYLVGGDLDLSLTMTFFSTLLALVMMPFWMWALGHLFIDDSRVDIPYVTLVRTLATFVLPLLVGVLIRRYCPKRFSLLFVRITKPITLIFIVFMLTYGTWVNWYMYIIMATVPQVIPAAILLPWFGYLLGYVIAYFLGRLGMKRSITVGIETGYQNPSIPIVMLQGNFVQPEGDLGAVMPVATAFFTPVPIYVYYIYLEIKRKACGRGALVENEKGSEEEQEEGVSVEKGEENIGQEDMKKENEGGYTNEAWVEMGNGNETEYVNEGVSTGNETEYVNGGVSRGNGKDILHHRTGSTEITNL